jgi:hypothetical protein
MKKTLIFLLILIGISAKAQVNFSAEIAKLGLPKKDTIAIRNTECTYSDITITLDISNTFTLCNGCELSNSEIDQLFIDYAAANDINGLISLIDQNGYATTASAAARATLLSNGWTLYFNSIPINQIYYTNTGQSFEKGVAITPMDLVIKDPAGNTIPNTSTSLVLNDFFVPTGVSLNESSGNANFGQLTGTPDAGLPDYLESAIRCVGLNEYTGFDDAVVKWDLSATTPLALSNLRMAADGQTTSIGGVTSTLDTATIHWVITTTSNPPTATQVKNGQDYLGAAPVFYDSVNTTFQITKSTYERLISSDGLTENTAYYCHITAEDKDDVLQNVLTTSFSTPLSNPDPIVTTWNVEPIACSDPSINYILTTSGTYDGITEGWVAGDTIGLDGDFTFSGVLRFNKLRGSAAEPIVIRNCDGRVEINPGVNGISVQDSSYHFKIIGDSVGGVYDYGIFVNETRTAPNTASQYVVVEDLGSDFELAGIEVSGNATGWAGIQARTATTSYCDMFEQNEDYSAWVMRNVFIHNNYVHFPPSGDPYEGRGEGVYIGVGLYDGTSSGCPARSWAHSVRNFHFYSNIIINAGWDGVQIKNNDSISYVYNNVIDGYGFSGETAHSEGLFMGEGATGKIYNNVIKNGDGVTNGSALQYSGVGNFEIYNNVVSVSGNEDGLYSFWEIKGARFTYGYWNVYNNTIYHANVAKKAIQFSDDLTGNKRLYNNIAAGGDGTIGFSSTNLDSANNYINADTAVFKFNYPANDDFSILTSSVAIDGGSTLVSVATDILGVGRPQGSFYDIGAYEYVTVVDVTAPVLTSATDIDTGSTTGSGTVTTDEDNGTLYFAITQSATTPSVTQIKAGQDHTSTTADDSGNQSVSATGVQNVSFTGLTASTAYYAHYVHMDLSTNNSNTITADGFTTQAGGSYDFLNALEFDGTNDNVDFTGFDMVLSTTFTLSMWVQPTTGWAGGEAIIGKNGNNNRILIFSGSGTTITYRNDASNVVFLCPTTITTGGSWYHLVVVKTATDKMRIYVNGTESASGEQTVDAGTFTWDKIGRTGAASNLLHAIIDDVVIWDATIATSGNVISLYNSGSGVDPTTVIASPNRLYKCDSSSGTVLIDGGSDGQDGTLQNFTVPAAWVTH